MNNDERSGCHAGSHRTLTRAAGGWTLAIWQARWDRLQPNATRFSNIGNSCGSCGADLQVCAGPPGPALRATEPAISAHEQADVDVGRRTEWSPAPRITQLAQNGKTSDIRLQPVNVAQGRASRATVAAAADASLDQATDLRLWIRRPDEYPVRRVFSVLNRWIPPAHGSPKSTEWTVYDRRSQADTLPMEPEETKDAVAFKRSAQPLQWGAQVVLLASFGGMLALMLFAGIDSLRALRQVQSRNVQIRQTFLLRNRALEEIRSALYQSGTFTRDYLLERDASRVI